MTLSEIQSKINSAKALDFGDVISQCIDLFKKFWVQGLLTIIIIAVITVPIALISQFILGIQNEQSNLKILVWRSFMVFLELTLFIMHHLQSLLLFFKS